MMKHDLLMSGRWWETARSASDWFYSERSGAMDEPTSGRKSIFPEEVSDDQDRDDPDQFGRLTESELNEDPDLDPMEVV
jgi:hypothetical protein